MGQHIIVLAQKADIIPQGIGASEMLSETSKFQTYKALVGSSRHGVTRTSQFRRGKHNTLKVLNSLNSVLKPDVSTRLNRDSEGIRAENPSKPEKNRNWVKTRQKTGSNRVIYKKKNPKSKAL